MMNIDLRLVDWDAVTPDEAWELRARWDDAARDRDEWLRSSCPAALDFTRESLPQVWEWLRAWIRDPAAISGSAPPEPVFWQRPLTGSITEQRYAGVEAVVGYLEQVLWRRLPELVPAIARTPTGRQTAVMDQYAPGLDWARRVKWGAAVDTGSLATRMGYVFDANPDDEFRLRDWLVRSHDDFLEALKTSKKDLGKPPTPKAKVSKWRDPDDPTFAWEVWFDEETLDDFPSVVESTADMLAGLDGISEVHHHDRNAVLVGGTVTAAQLRAALKSHLGDGRGR